MNATTGSAAIGGRPLSGLMQGVLRHGDRVTVLAQQLLGWVTHAPSFEEDLAICNIALDLLGQSRALYSYAGELEGSGRMEDDFAFLRAAGDFLNPRLVEQPNGDFAHTIVRQFLHDAYATALWRQVRGSPDQTLAGLAAKAEKETRYHRRYGAEWLVRLGDGTDESHARAQTALDALSPYVAELFEPGPGDDEMGIDPRSLRAAFDSDVAPVLLQATLIVPLQAAAPPEAGRSHLAGVLQEMQAAYRAHPGAEW